MVSEELGIQVEDEQGGVLQGALLMGAAFGLGAIVPIVPFLLLPSGSALPIAMLVTAAVLLGIGAAKSRWTHRSATVPASRSSYLPASPASPATSSAPFCRNSWAWRASPRKGRHARTE